MALHCQRTISITLYPSSTPTNIIQSNMLVFLHKSKV
uniref:Uncharacterized protein n=1 Tax=Arundo donax TaxID=35708 RepID=A0A0A9BEQ8_ARUDO